MFIYPPGKLTRLSDDLKAADGVTSLIIDLWRHRKFLCSTHWTHAIFLISSRKVSLKKHILIMLLSTRKSTSQNQEREERVVIVINKPKGKETEPPGGLSVSATQHASLLYNSSGAARSFARRGRTPVKDASLSAKRRMVLPYHCRLILNTIWSDPGPELFLRCRVF
jgi:hypothetical protein